MQAVVRGVRLGNLKQTNDCCPVHFDTGEGDYAVLEFRDSAAQ
jgi:hypothetical protein